MFSTVCCCRWTELTCEMLPTNKQQLHWRVLVILSKWWRSINPTVVIPFHCILLHYFAIRVLALLIRLVKMLRHRIYLLWNIVQKVHSTYKIKVLKRKKKHYSVHNCSTIMSMLAMSKCGRTECPNLTCSNSLIISVLSSSGTITVSLCTDHGRLLLITLKVNETTELLGIVGARHFRHCFFSSIRDGHKIHYWLHLRTLYTNGMRYECDDDDLQSSRSLKQRSAISVNRWWTPVQAASRWTRNEASTSGISVDLSAPTFN